jgi:CheY-like chemotaxis protein
MKNLRTILLVEDNANDVELTLEALEEHNLANGVMVVRDGVEAVDYLSYKGIFAMRKKEMPALILLDIKMPRMNGLDVLKIIKKDENLKNIPVVMLSSSREEPDLRTSYELGANAYVVKPVDFKEFVDAVKTLGVFWALINEIPSENRSV